MSAKRASRMTARQKKATTTADDFSRWKRDAWPKTVPFVVVESDLVSDPECPDWFKKLVYGIAGQIERLPMTAEMLNVLGLGSGSRVAYLNSALTLIGYSEDC